MHDLHAWCVLPNGKILDYSKGSLKTCSAYGTEDVVYVPFDEETQQKCLKHWSKRYEDRVVSGDMCREMQCGIMSLYQLFLNQVGLCQYRSLYIASRDQKNRIKVVFGSLGFRQPDGSVYYEFG
jgi:hypothetical protein